MEQMTFGLLLGGFLILIGFGFILGEWLGNKIKSKFVKKGVDDHE